MSSLTSELLEQHCKSKDHITCIQELFQHHGLTPNNNHDVSDYEFFYEACINEKVTEEIIQYLLDYFPNAARSTNNRTPLHCACRNKNVTVNIIRILIDAAPAAVQSVNMGGDTPLHYLCRNKDLDEKAAVEILKLFIEKRPEAVRHVNNNIGCLPIHFAAAIRSPEFCRVLIEAYPGSERYTNTDGAMPLHSACRTNTLPTVEYLYRLFPAAIARADNLGFSPIHATIRGTKRRDNPASATEIVQFLLNCDSSVKAQRGRGMSLLQLACGQDYNESNIEAGMKMIKFLFDAHPEAIEDQTIVSSIQDYHHQVQEFINGELVYARQAKDHRLMTTPDMNRQLPLHIALQNNVRLGSIKLLVKGNPCAIRYVGYDSKFPLHTACQHHDSASVVQYLLSLDATVLDAVDRHRNTALHYACQGAKYKTIALLLEKYDAALVFKSNAYGELPIHLLLLCSAVAVDRDCVEYTGSIFQLMRAYPFPELVALSYGYGDERKRKFCHNQEE